MTSEAEADKLERWIIRLDTLYEAGLPCINIDTKVVVSDVVYDSYRQSLRTLRPNSSVFKTSTASTLLPKIKVPHNPPMTSLAKINGSEEEKEADLGKFLTRINDRFLYGDSDLHKWFVISYKIDGVAIALYYEEGKLVRAGTRSKSGLEGKDITEHTRYITGIKRELPLPITCSLRGEVYCPRKDFANLHHMLDDANKPFSNPRSLAAGSLNLKSPKRAQHRCLEFVAYSVENLKLSSFPYATELERASWVTQKLGVPFVTLRKFEYELLDKMEEHSSDLIYDTDGLVISVNVLADAEELGRHGDKSTGNPRGKVAWKFFDKRAYPVVTEVEWNIGRTGMFTPVCIFDTVTLAGAEISRATCHNLGFLQKGKGKGPIGEGSKIIIKRSGKVIPTIIGVVNHVYYPKIPTDCPHCDTVLIRQSNDDNIELICKNRTCPGRVKAYLEYYLKTIGTKGIGSRTVNDLYENNLVTLPSDFYTLTIESLRKIGWAKRESILTIARIHLLSNADAIDSSLLVKMIREAKGIKKIIPFDKVITSLGIKGTSDSMAQLLIEHFHTFDKIRRASEEDLIKVKGIGSVLSKGISEFFVMNPMVVDSILEHIMPKIPNVKGNFSGKLFVLSGSLQGGKDKWKISIEDNGGKVVSRVSKQVSYLVAGKGSKSKSEKARELNLAIIGVEELKKMLEKSDD